MQYNEQYCSYKVFLLRGSKHLSSVSMCSLSCKVFSYGQDGYPALVSVFEDFKRCSQKKNNNVLAGLDKNHTEEDEEEEECDDEEDEDDSFLEGESSQGEENKREQQSMKSGVGDT